MSVDKTAVERAAKLLDDARPGWEHEVDINLLDMLSLHNCVLGQLYGHYDRGKLDLQLSNSDQSQWGPFCDGGRYWRDEILKRRNGMGNVRLSGSDRGSYAMATKKIALIDANSNRVLLLSDVNNEITAAEHALTAANVQYIKMEEV